MTHDRFTWQRHPDAEQYIHSRLSQLTAALPAARELELALAARTSTRLADWLDHLVLADGDTPRTQLAALGFALEGAPAEPGDAVYHHPAAILPWVVLRQHTAAEGTALAAAVRVEDAAEFLMAHHLTASIEGAPLSPYRRARAWTASGRELWVVERRGQRGLMLTELPSDYPQRYLQAFERWAARPRQFNDTLAGMGQTLHLTQELVSDLGTDTAAWVAFAAERAHWQQRNWAGQMQRARQDRLGLGWANHDHHTFRSSREAFTLLIQILETLGFRPRERFYAGAEAGWGAQVMEQPAARLAVFADVDLSPEEAAGDFAHAGLAPRAELGTVGLWCALHGESMLSAGLHHLAARLSFHDAAAELAALGVETMRPFSQFSYLQQAFTRGERWQPAGERLDRLIAAGQITPQQRERFAAEGAVGSHLENIQRGDGFKGFNQQMVSDIIRRTDPRTEHGAA